MTALLCCLAAGSAVAEVGANADANSSVSPPSVAVISDTGAGTPAAPSLAGALPVADAIVVHKSERRLYLMRRGEVLRSYRVALGLMPEGAKERAGDFRTPEGRYQIARRNSRSDYFLSMQVSYPNDQDLRRAHRNHEDPGGSIMIHGLPNYQRHPPDYYATADWTDGCIAMSNSDMVEVWLMTQDNTPIDILP